MDAPPLSAPLPQTRPAWQTCLQVEAQEALHYQDFVNTAVLDAIDGAPRRVLDLGCAGGALGAALKARFPEASVVGIEAGRAAATLAGQRLDRAICARLEQVDFGREGLQPREFDTVIAADILEHVVNPWELLLRVKPLLAAHGQVVASIPNVRNLWLASRLLLEGRWEYLDRGLLDVTHVRFFTLTEMGHLFADTGYRLEGYSATILPSLRALYKEHRDGPPRDLRIGRLALSGVTAQELLELCAEQFIVRARNA